MTSMQEVATKGVAGCRSDDIDYLMLLASNLKSKTYTDDEIVHIMASDLTRSLKMEWEASDLDIIDLSKLAKQCLDFVESLVDFLKTHELWSLEALAMQNAMVAAWYEFERALPTEEEIEEEEVEEEAIEA